MRDDTDALIEKLARDSAPVKPLAPPLARAGVFIALAIAVSTVVATVGGDVDSVWSNLSHLAFAGSLAGALSAGISAIVAAVVLSVPGRSDAWALLPLPGALLWLASGGVECYQSVAAVGWGDGDPFASRVCFEFIVTAGAPVAAGLFFVLRRSVATNIAGVTALAGLGAAMLAAALLQFMHAHGANPIDLATHIAAVALLMVAMMTLGRRGLERV